MGCSSSRVARGGVEIPSALPASARSERLHRLPSRSSSALDSLGLCRGGLDGVHAYPALALVETVSGEAPSAEAKAAVSHGGDAAAWPAEGLAPMKALPGAKRGLVAVLEDAPSATSTTPLWTASGTSTTTASPSWFRGESSSSTPPVQFLAPDFVDPAILSMFREAFVVPSPSHPGVVFPEKEATPPLETSSAVDEVLLKPAARDIPEVSGLVRARVEEFHAKLLEKKRKKEAEAEALQAASDTTEEAAAVAPPTRKVVVVYFTSIRGVRRTFLDGRAVRAILGGYRVLVDERDVSMHAAFKDELYSLVDVAKGGGQVLPRVFVFTDGEEQVVVDLGGADEVSALHEDGELAQALAGCEKVPVHLPPCDGCGDLRFLPCDKCSGSCKLFAGDEGACPDDMFERCPDCNENGLIRCPVCCL